MLILALVILVAPQFADAQQPGKVPRIGYLSSTRTGPSVEGFRQGLLELGYVEGKNIAIEFRFAEGEETQLADVAAELVQLNTDLIVAASSPAIRAAQLATKTIPSVMALRADPVRTGFVASLARPGGNITGLSHLAPELNGKRLELLKEAVPRVSRVAALLNPSNPAAAASLRETQSAARSLAVQLQILEA